jgi:hypothetical protein
LGQLRCLRLHTFVNVLLGFLLTAVDRYAPLLSMLCAFFVVHVPRIFAPHAPQTLEERATARCLKIPQPSPWRGDALSLSSARRLDLAFSVVPFPIRQGRERLNDRVGHQWTGIIPGCVA